MQYCNFSDIQKKLKSVSLVRSCFENIIMTQSKQSENPTFVVVKAGSDYF